MFSSVSPQDKHWLIRQAKTPMSNSSVQFLDDAFRKRSVFAASRLPVSVHVVVFNYPPQLVCVLFAFGSLSVFLSHASCHLFSPFSPTNVSLKLFLSPILTI